VSLAARYGKQTVVCDKDTPGFITSRLIIALGLEAMRIVEEGISSVEDVNTACRLGFGHAMGPLATTDLTGVDILRNASRNIYDESQDEKFAPPELLNRMVSAGDLGRKSGRGFYAYDR
jgi:3-hydroxybutyryl-CoA dehydrogenase